MLSHVMKYLFLLWLFFILFNYTKCLSLLPPIAKNEFIQTHDITFKMSLKNVRGSIELFKSLLPGVQRQGFSRSLHRVLASLSDPISD